MAGGNDSNAKLLLHCEGTNGSTTFTDVSIGGGHAFVAGGATAVSTALMRSLSSKGLTPVERSIFRRGAR